MDISSNLQNHWLWKDKPFAKGQAWIDLLFLADSEFIFFRGRRHRLPKGQLITSENELSKRWEWSRNKVRSFLLLLCDESMLKIDPSNSNTLITIIQTSRKTAKQQSKEQIIIPKKEQVKIQPNYTDNDADTTKEKQADKQFSNKSLTEKESVKENTFRQLTIMDAINGNI